MTEQYRYTRAACRSVWALGDEDGDGDVQSDDLLAVIATNGTSTNDAADINRDGVTDGTLLEVRVLIERWREHYSTVRPHSSLGYCPPTPETIAAGPPSAPLQTVQQRGDTVGALT